MNYIEWLFIGLSAASGVNCFATTMSHSGKRLPAQRWGFSTKGCDVKLQKKRMVFNFGSISNSSSHGPSWWSKASQSIQCRKQSILSPLEALNIFCHPQKSETGDQRVREVLIAWSTPLERYLRFLSMKQIWNERNTEFLFYLKSKSKGFTRKHR